ncbi:hypothetical protein [Streptomyces naphthomycinicus]|uniref:hypothetical protein n=1 Tax=Streptomyces naphthomycinicus TaxID=2872625 RepID=UPI001CEC3C13|nr:hypothetical protein [Streptomyces sp. TML10]
MRKILPLVLTGLFAVSACQLVGDDDPGDEAHRLNAMTSFPLHAYLPDAGSADGKAIGTAQWIVARKCMVRLGFTGFKTLDIRTVDATYPVRQGTLAGSSSRLGDDSPYGVDDPDLAAEHGYHDRPHDEGTDQAMEWPADQYTALTGTFESGESHQAHGRPIPEKGCMGEALRKIAGPEPEPTEIGGIKLTGHYSVAATLWYTAHKAATKKAAWKKAGRAWSDCMKKAGFHYPGPDEASADSDWFGTEKASGKEKKTAAADARCKLDTEYIQSVHAIESRAQKDAIAQHKKALEDQRAADARTLANARRIVAGQS